MAPRPDPEPPTVDDLTYLTELSAPVETLTTRMSRTPTFVENTVRRASDLRQRADQRQRSPRDRINAQAW